MIPRVIYQKNTNQHSIGIFQNYDEGALLQQGSRLADIDDTSGKYLLRAAGHAACPRIAPSRFVLGVYRSPTN